MPIGAVGTAHCCGVPAVTVRLTCDSPGCGKETAAEPIGVSFRAPDGWWMQVSGNRIIVACCTDHLNEALKARPA